MSPMCPGHGTVTGVGKGLIRAHESRLFAWVCDSRGCEIVERALVLSTDDDPGTSV